MSTPSYMLPLSQQIQNVGREVINNLGYQIDGVQAHLGAVRNDLQLARTELAGLREEFRQFVEETIRAAAVQQSQVTVVDLKARLDRESGTTPRSAEPPSVCCRVSTWATSPTPWLPTSPRS